MPLLLLFLFLIVLAPGSPASGQELRYTLRHAISAAFQKNHELAAFTSALAAQGEDVGIARSTLYPKIAFEERFLRTNNPPNSFMVKLNQERFTESDFKVSSLNSPTPVNDFQTTFSFEQPLFVRQASIGVDMAKTEYSAKREEFDRKREEIASRVAETFLAVHTSKEFVRVSEKAVEDAAEHLRIANLRYSEGVGLYSDSLRAATSLASAEQKRVGALRNLKTAQLALGLLTGAEGSVDIEGDFPSCRLKNIGEYLKSSMQRKDISAFEKRSENAKNGIRLANAGYLPVVALGGSYQFNDHRAPFGSEGDSWQLVAFLRWNLFDGLKREHEKSRAVHKASEMEQHFEGFRKYVIFKVHEAFLGVEEASKKMELARNSAKSAEEGKRLVSIRYESSLAPIVDLLDAQTNLDLARSQFVAAENDLRIAHVRLSFESGTILEDLSPEPSKETP